jgi:GTP cyclohydrolase I
MDRQKIERGVRLMLEGLGEDITREGLAKTPERVAKMCEEIFEGIGREPELKVGFTEDVGTDTLIKLKDIDFYSVCEHHLLPFFGQVEIIYAPKNNLVAGFSDFAKIVDTYARRPQIQERLTNQIADAVMNFLQPHGVRVMVKATQLCVSMRGRHKKDMQTVTEAQRGELPQNRVRNL